MATHRQLTKTRLYDAIAHLQVSRDTWTSRMHTRMLVCLARYRLLAQDSGSQGALPTRVLDSLRRRFGVETECFASPLNHYLPRFYSFFPDSGHV